MKRKQLQGYLLDTDEALGEQGDIPTLTEEEAIQLLKVITAKQEVPGSRELVYRMTTEVRTAGWNTLSRAGYYVELDGAESYILFKRVWGSKDA